MAFTSGDTINIWDVQSGHVIRVAGHKDKVNAIAFSPDDGSLASGGDDNKVKIWNAQTGQLERDLFHEQPVTAVAFSLDGRWLATVVDKEIKMWSRETWAVAHSLSHNDRVQMFAFNRDGQRLASQTEDDFITLWIAPSWDRPKSKIKIQPTEAAEAFSPDLRFIAVAHNDGTISLRELSRD